jgi:hypothetical protein
VGPSLSFFVDADGEIGPHIGFGGCAVTGRPTMEIFSLTPLNFHSSNDKLYRVLARHLSALKTGLENLQKEATEPPRRNGSAVRAEESRRPRRVARLSHNASAQDSRMPFHAPIYSYPTSFTSLESQERETFSFGEEMEGRKLFFKGKTSKGKPICVKFVRRYGKEVHEWCAGKGLAPKLLGFEVLAGGWYMVVMELLDASWVNFTLDKVKGAKGVKENLFGLIKELHEAGMVHGDIRRENVMMKEGGSEIWLVDFDWAGIVGGVWYPRHVNKAAELGRPEDVSDEELILARHDVAMAEYMFKTNKCTLH